MVRMGILLSHSLYLLLRVLLLTWATPGPGFLTWNVTVGHKIITIITKLSEAAMNLLSEKFQHPVSGSNQHFPIFPLTTPLSITIQDCMPDTVPTGVSPWFSQPSFFSSLSKSRCRLIQKHRGMLRWQECHVDYIVGEWRGKTHPEHIRSKWVRLSIDLSAVPGPLGHLPYAQHCWTLKNLHWAQILL